MPADHYVPLLRMKRGEAIALRGLPDDVKGSTTPLLLGMTPTSDDPEEEMRTRVESAMRGWPDNSEVWIDVAPLVNDGVADPTTLLRGAQAGADTCSVVPVIGIDLPQAEEWPDSDRLVLRLQPDDAVTLLGGGPIVGELLDARSVELSDVDVVIDFGVAPHAGRAEAIIRGLAALGQWRSVTLAAGSFSRPTTRGLHRMARDEWDVWCTVADRPHADAAGPLRYGDYAVLEADWTPPDVPFGAVDVAPRLVYTTDDETIIARGRSVRQHGWEQVQGLARRITEQPEWEGADFSPGDQDIAAWASGASPTGSSETTLRASMSHHLAQVARQLANRP